MASRSWIAKAGKPLVKVRQNLPEAGQVKVRVLKGRSKCMTISFDGEQGDASSSSARAVKRLLGYALLCVGGRPAERLSKKKRET